MSWKRAAVWGLVSWVGVAPVGAFDIDRETVQIRHLELPLVDVAGLDFASLRAEVAYGEVAVGEPALKTTSSICVPKGSKNPLKDAIELPTHYYEVPYRVTGGVMIVRNGDGTVLYGARIDDLESTERYGFDECRYWRAEPLALDFERDQASLHVTIEKTAREYFVRSTGERLDDALFFNVVDEKIPLYLFKDKKRSYSDLNLAARLAESGYRAFDGSDASDVPQGRAELERALSIWETALDESDLNDKRARINRKVTRKLHESIGAARMVLGDTERAVLHLDKANRLGMTTSRSDGTGSADLLERAQQRKARAGRNPGLREAGPADLDRLVRATAAFRGRIPIEVLHPTARARLRAEHDAFVATAVLEAADAAQAEHEAAVAAGRVNPYERMVGQSAMQGFFLFLMPYPEKLPDFPSEVCDLTHLNRLRVPNHVFDSIPDEIGKLTALEVLDLSGNRLRTLPQTIGSLASLEKLDLSDNRIESLPEEIGRLDKLKVLQLKGNPLAPGEVERLRRLLPRCKIKA